MGLYHSVGIAYGFGIPTDTDIDELDELLAQQPKARDSIGYVVIGDRDQLLLVTRFTTVAENIALRLTVDELAQPAELAAWESALHDVAVRLSHPDHPAPAWLVVHNYR